MEVNIAGNKIIVKGPKGAVAREFPTRNLQIKKEGNAVEIRTDNKNAAGRALVGTFTAHLKNIFAGVQKPYVYRLKICATHFPMSAKVDAEGFVLTNFLGGKRLKKVKIPKDVSVKVSGEIIEVESPNLELAGMLASRLEQLSRVNNKDKRTFQDGIYIIEKPGKR
jgi:large subunit ribosomal protein L6